MTELQHRHEDIDEARSVATVEAPEKAGVFISRRKLIGGGAVLAVATAGALTFSLIRGTGNEVRAEQGAPDPAKNDKATSVTPAPTESAEHGAIPIPTEAPTPYASPTPETVVETYGIKEGLSADEYGKELIDRLSTWIMLGTSEELFTEWGAANGADASKAVLANVANTNADDMADALFMKEWQDQPSLVTFHDKERNINRADLDSWVHTHNSHRPEDVEEWNNSVSFDSVKVISNEEKGRLLQITGTQHNNAAKNRIGLEYDPSQIEDNGIKFIFEFSTTIEDGREVITSYTNLTPQ